MDDFYFSPDLQDSLDVLKALSWNDFFIFSRYVLNYDRLSERVHGPFCQFIARPLLNAWDIPPPPKELYGVGETGEDFAGEWLTDEPHITRGAGLRRQVIIMPRGSFKTTIVSICLPLWILIHRPDWKIMIASLSRDESTRLINIIKQHLQSNKRLSYIAGGKCYDSEKVRQGKNRWAAWEVDFALMRQLSETPSLWATSVDSYKPGRHPHVAIYDDILDQNIVSSELELQRVVEFHNYSQAPLSEPAIVYTVGTFYGEFDLYHQLLEKRYEKIVGAYVRSSYLPDGTLWWPEGLSEEVLESKRAVLPPWVFASQFRSIVVPRRDRVFRLEDIDFFNIGAAPPREKMKVVCMIDPADVRAQGDSSWAIAIVGIDENQHFWDLDSVKARANAAQITAEAIKKIKDWRADVILVESTGFSRSYIDATLKPALVQMGIHVPLVEVSPGGRSKQYRIADVENGFGAIVQNRRFHMRDDNWAGKNELVGFPDATKSFDWLDAVAYVLSWAGAQRFYPRFSSEEHDNSTKDPVVREFNLMCQKALRRRDWLETPRYCYRRPGVRERIRS